MSDCLKPQGLQPARFLWPWNSPGKNAGVGGPSLLQGIFPTQGYNPGLSCCRWVLYHLSHRGSHEGTSQPTKRGWPRAKVNLKLCFSNPLFHDTSQHRWLCPTRRCETDDCGEAGLQPHLHQPVHAQRGRCCPLRTLLTCLPALF